MTVLDGRYEVRVNNAQMKAIKDGMKAEEEKNTISKEIRKLLCKLEKRYTK